MAKLPSQPQYTDQQRSRQPSQLLQPSRPDFHAFQLHPNPQARAFLRHQRRQQQLLPIQDRQLHLLLGYHPAWPVFIPHQLLCLLHEELQLSVPSVLLLGAFCYFGHHLLPRFQCAPVRLLHYLRILHRLQLLHNHAWRTVIDQLLQQQPNHPDPEHLLHH